MFARPLLAIPRSYTRLPTTFIQLHVTKRAFIMTSSNLSSATAKAQALVDFINNSPTPYHAVNVAAQELADAGFKEIKERDSWSSTLQPGGKYYLTRNGSSIIAFGIGKKWKAGNPISIVGAHTDSCTLRLKPVSKKTGSGFLQVGVETYGGGKWHTWFDRDLSVAGRVMVKDGKGNYLQKLVKVDRPILRIPTLAIHLDREKSFDPNTETELFPIAGLVAAELNRTGKTAEDQKENGNEASDKPFQPLQSATERHHTYLVEIIAEHADVSVEDVVDFELVLYDTQKAVIGGINNELIFAARLDNLGMTHGAVQGLITSVASPTALDNDSTIRLISCFDHEEIGSASAQGAKSNFLPAILRRLSVIPSAGTGSSGAARESEDISTAYEQTLATSFIVSADMAHSVHPNYTHKYESDHRPEMNKGTVIKVNANQRYMTNSPGIVLLQEAARLAKPAAESTSASGVPLQLFVVRNDSSCGSTIGPMVASLLGTRTIDVGNAQLSMHSIRETAGVYDVEHATRLFASFFENYGALESKIMVD